MHVKVDTEVTVRVEDTTTLRAQEAASFGRVLGALVLKQLRGTHEQCRAVHAWVLSIGMAFLLCTVKGMLAQQAGRERAVVMVVVVVVVRVSVGNVGFGCLLGMQEMRARMAAEAGEGLESWRANLGAGV